MFDWDVLQVILNRIDLYYKHNLIIFLAKVFKSMRIFTFAAITVAFVASVAGKFGFGPCREDVPQLAYADYEADTAYNHILFAMDHDFFELANVLDNLGFKFPLENWRCDDLNTISPFTELAEE